MEEQQAKSPPKVEEYSKQFKFYLDPNLQTPEERTAYVNKLVEAADPTQLTPRICSAMSEYILYKINKEERKQKNILTSNRMVTVNKREMSFEGLVSKFENGEDSIYGMIANDKNIIFTPKLTITPQDVEEIPGMKELQKAIAEVEVAAKKATGHKKYLLIRQSIEMKKEQYILRASYRRPIYFLNCTKSFPKIELEDKVTVNDDGTLDIQGTFSLLKPEHISALLCNYSRVKEESYDKFNSDSYYVIMDLEDLIERTLKENNPIYYDIIIYKIDGLKNVDIAKKLNERHGVNYSNEYISSIWRKKIPKALAVQAQKDWIVWHFTVEEKGKWKRCSRCGQIKLAHNFFFSKNKTSKDGFYSLCKDCRNKKTKKTKIKKGKEK